MRTGLGPKRITDAALPRLRAMGLGPEVVRLQADGAFMTENGTGFEVMRLMAAEVSRAMALGRLPVVLAGNCNTAVGTLAGLGLKRPGILWMDAHGDLNTPETTTSAFLDGMGLAMAMGRCWSAMTGNVPGFAPVPEARVVHLGGRDLDPPEADYLAASAIRAVPPGPEAAKAAGRALDLAGRDMDGLYVHLDADALDVPGALANHLDSPGGLEPAQVRRIMGMVRTGPGMAALAVTSYDPSFDAQGLILEAILGILDAALGKPAAGG